MRRVDGLLVAGALFGLLGVGAGALGAHGLRDRLEPMALDWWKTAAHYAQVHAVVLVALALARPARAGLLRIAGVAFVLGVAVFSGTLVAMALGGPRWLGAVTPLGGASLLAGWSALLVHAIRPRAD